MLKFFKLRHDSKQMFMLWTVVILIIAGIAQLLLLLSEIKGYLL